MPRHPQRRQRGPQQQQPTRRAIPADELQVKAEFVFQVAAYFKLLINGWVTCSGQPNSCQLMVDNCFGSRFGQLLVSANRIHNVVKVRLEFLVLHHSELFIFRQSTFFSGFAPGVAIALKHWVGVKS